MNKLNNDRIPVAIVDDDINVLNDISVLLGDFDRFELTGVYKSCNEAMKNFRSKTPDILLLDLNLKEGNAINFIPGLLSDSPSLKVVIYSNYFSPETAVKARAAGAKGYILKNTEVESLFRSILLIKKGEEIWPEELPEVNVSSSRNLKDLIRKLFISGNS